MSEKKHKQTLCLYQQPRYHACSSHDNSSGWKKTKNKADPLMLSERTHLAFRAVWISSASLWIPTHSSWKQLTGRVCLLRFSVQNMSNCVFTRGEREKKQYSYINIVLHVSVCTSLLIISAQMILSCLVTARRITKKKTHFSIFPYFFTFEIQASFSSSGLWYKLNKYSEQPCCYFTLTLTCYIENSFTFTSEPLLQTQITFFSPNIVIFSSY